MVFATDKLLRAAESRVRERLRERPKAPLLEAVVGGSGQEQISAVASLAVELSLVIGTDLEHLRASETFREALRVRREELSSEAGALMPQVGLSDVIDPFAFDLLDLAERRIREKPSRAQQEVFLPAPKNEDEWIERILDLTVADFLRALA
jgi:hypothetical protein